MSMLENTLCHAAFGDILLDANGDILPCCFVERDNNTLKIKDVDDLNDWFFNDKGMTSLRENLATNIKDKKCNVCWKAEAENKWTLRTGSGEYKLQPPKNKLLQIIGGRLCNLACRMCSPQLSSKIQAENRSWENNNLDHNYNWIDDPFNVTKVIDLVNNQNIEDIQLQGGEPQLMKGFVDIMTQIDSKKKSQISLQVTTNASVFNEKFWEQAVKFQRVQAGLSIDATGSRYDVIRYHGDWQTTKKNCDKIINYLWTHKIDSNATWDSNPAVNLNIVLQLANIDQCDVMNTFYEHLQERFPGLDYEFTLMPINNNNSWDIQNLPLKILNSLPDIKADTQLAKQWRDRINYAIENNGYNKYHKKQVLIREEHFKNVYGKNLWREKGGWMKIYNVSS